MNEFYISHYITVDEQSRITDGWSDGPQRGRDTTGAVLLTDRGGYQFRLFPDGEENPSLRSMDDIPLYAWRDGQVVLRTPGEVEADREALPPPPITEAAAMRTMLMSTMGISVEPEQLAQAQSVVVSASGAELDVPEEGEWKPGEFVTAGVARAYSGTTYLCRQSHCTQADWTPPLVPALWEVKAPEGATEWLAGATYKTGGECTYKGIWYVCVQGHTSQAGWEPPNIPALWKKK